MSYKTDRLVALFPDAYAAKESESLLYKLLDAIGFELMQADEAVKRLLKSHWVNYAEEAALDGLASTFGVARRQLVDGALESDEAFRQRLKAIVPLFTGGGTKQAVIGAVRSALGLPFDLTELNLPEEFAKLREDIEKLIFLEEFSPTGQRIINRTVQEVNGASELILDVQTLSAQEDKPTLQWKFRAGSGRRLTLQRLDSGEGIKSLDSLIVPANETLTLTTEAGTGKFVALLDLMDVSSQFTALDDAPPQLPEVPEGPSEWKFRAQSGLFELGRFDVGDTFDLPQFEVEMSWLRYQPLTFDVHVPYFLQEAVENLKRLHGYTGRLFVFKGLPLAVLPEVVDQTRAAGVRGSVQFFLNFLDIHHQNEKLFLEGEHSLREEAGATESLLASSVNDVSEHHETGERFVIGAVFGVSRFDKGHGFGE